MISIKLLSEVLGLEVKAVEQWGENCIRCFATKDYIINIHELAHKVKEWAIAEGYQFQLYIREDGSTEVNIGKHRRGWDLTTIETNDIWEIEAGQWILENRK